MDTLVPPMIKHLVFHDILLIQHLAPEGSSHAGVLHQGFHLLNEETNTTIQVGIDKAFQLFQLQLQLELLQAVNHLLELVLQLPTRLILLYQVVEIVGTLESHLRELVVDEIIQF